MINVIEYFFYSIKNYLLLHLIFHQQVDSNSPPKVQFLQRPLKKGSISSKTTRKVESNIKLWFLSIFFYWKLKITYISIWFFIFSPLIRTWLAQILLRGFNFFRKLWNFSIWFFICSPLIRTWLAQILLERFNFFRNLWKFESKQFIMLSK